MSLIEENIISHEEECFIRYPNMEMWLEKQGAAKFFLTHFKVFGTLMKLFLECLI